MLCLKSNNLTDLSQVDQACLASCLASRYLGFKFVFVIFNKILQASFIVCSLIPPKLIISPIHSSLWEAFQKGTKDHQHN